jgi:hypothetical protein
MHESHRKMERDAKITGKEKEKKKKKKKKKKKG